MTLHFRCIFALSFFIFSGIILIPAQAQRYSLLQLEVGTGAVISSNEQLAPALQMSLELKAQKGILDLGLRYQRSLAGIGIDHPDLRLFPDHQQLIATLSPPDPNNLRRLKYLESLQILGHLHLNLEFFKPIIGVGLTLNHFRPYEHKRFPYSGSPDLYRVIPPNFAGWMIRLGQKIDRMRFYFEFHHNGKDGLGPLYQLGTAVNFGVSQQTAREVKLYKSEFKESRFENLIFRIEFSTGLLASLHAEKGSGAVSVGTEIQLRLINEHFLGFGATFLTRFAGFDKGTQERLDERVLLLSNASDQTRYLSVSYIYNYEFTVTRALFSGIGLGLYTYPTELEPIPVDVQRISTPFPYETTRVGGMNVFLGLRSGLLSNTIRLNFPFGKYPVLFEYKLGVGLNFHK